MNINVFSLDSAPKPFNPYIVQASSAAVHTDFYIKRNTCVNPQFARILNTLVGINIFRHTMLSYSLDKHLILQCVRRPQETM